MIMRRKSRYVLVASSKPFDISKELGKFEAKLAEIVGIIEMAEMGLLLAKKLDDKAFIFRLSRGKERRFILALSFLKLDGVSFYSILTSGTIKSLLRKYNSLLAKNPVGD
ncbi:MAG: hypothetical protein ACP5P2_00725 [Candidatus Micrarchaeia archaeon]|jgi:RNase P/RNase MRP subunit POP5